MSERQKKKIAQKEATRLKRRMIEKVLSSSKTSNVAFNLNLLVDGWLELESDPGTFSLLIEDFGCFGAQVDEIYDLEQKFEGPVFGFIFLFKWLNNQNNDRLRNQKPTSSLNNTSIDCEREQQPPEQRQWTYVEDENIISQMFFAKQMISNSCATHALISILLNCDYDELNLGPTLTRLKEHTKIMNPENKGYAIGNLPELAKAHNSHASYSSLYNRTKSYSGSGMSYIISGNQRTNLQQKNHEAYHFVSYVPINNRLYELDGLKNYPIDHGPVGPKGDWTEKFRSVIKQRLSANKSGEDTSISNDIRYSLMAVVPDKRVYLKANLRRMKAQYQIVQESMRRLTSRVISPLTVDADIPNPPYSPLSNGTLTASEDGSRCGSPSRSNNNIPSDHDCKIDKYFFVKFDKHVNSTVSREDNSEPAHRNCIIDHESTDLSPVDLTKSSKDDTNNDKECKNNRKSLDSKNDTTSSSNNGANIKDAKGSKEYQLERIRMHGSKVILPPMQEIRANGNSNDDEVKANEVIAHGNLKYNLSTEPPFDFNILDDMQHVHVGKSTLKDLKSLSERLAGEIEKLRGSLKEEVDKRRKYKIDNSRRTHNYEPFIMTFLAMLAKQGKLADLIEKDLGFNTEECSTAQGPPRPQVYKTPKLQSATSSKVAAPNGGAGIKPMIKGVTKPKYKYVKTGRPVGRPRKHPLVPPATAKPPNAK